ncbi:MAG: class I SAM-dependent methyltransferase [Elusimicrobiota bacterium]
MKNYNSGDKILDVGCGEGLFLLTAAKEFPDSKFVGVDSWNKILEYTKQKLILEDIKNVELKFLDGKSLPFEDGSFQHVFFLNAVYNQKSIEDVGAVIKEMMRVCSRGGKVYFDIRNNNNVIFRIVYKFLLIFDSTKPIIRLHNKKIINEILSNMNCSEFEYFPIDIFRTAYLVEVTK